MDKKQEVEKEYKINEAVLVTYYTLDALYQNMCTLYPNDIEKKIVNLINDLRDDLESEQEKDFIGYDIKDSYYEKVVYVNDNE